MELQHTNREGILIIIPKIDNLDARDSLEFKEQLLNIIQEQKSSHVIIDLHQMQFIDSSGLGSFLAILKNLHAQGGELKLSAMNKPIRTIFELISLHKIFEIFNSTDDAFHSFNHKT